VVILERSGRGNFLAPRQKEERMETIAVIVLVILVLAVVAAFVVVQRNRRRAELQDRFGPEYDRAVSETGSRREAEQHLAAVAHKRDKLEIRELEPRQRAQFVEQWELVQARFVDEPAAAVDGAELLIATVMHERGYPVDDFEERADLVAADHADVVDHYRAAHASHERHRTSGGADTEDLRQAFVHYRSLFDTLVGREGLNTTPDHLETTTTDAGDTRVEETRAESVELPGDEPDHVQRAERHVDLTDDGTSNEEARR
jgi:hypothetical protein